MFPSCECSVQISHVLQLFHGFDSPVVPLIKPPSPPSPSRHLGPAAVRITVYAFSPAPGPVRIARNSITGVKCAGGGRQADRAGVQGVVCCPFLQTAASQEDFHGL